LKKDFSERDRHARLDSLQAKLEENKIEGVNIEYGNIKNCKFDSDLRSKIWRLVTSKR